MGQANQDTIEVPSPKFPLEIKLDTTTAEHEEEIHRILDKLPERLPPGVREIVPVHVLLLKELHPRLFRSSQTLIQENLPIPFENIRQALPVYKDLFLLEDLVKVHLARDMIADLCAATERAHQLLELAFEVRITPVAQAYLARVARCFTWGYEAECLILCRSVLEQVLEETVSDRDVFNAFHWRPETFPPLRREELRNHGAAAIKIGDRIDAAHALGRLSADDAAAARAVRDRGNKAVHDAPSARTNLLGTIRTLVRIITMLSH